MADNVPITAGTGTSIATDDVGGVHHQQVKLVDGTLGSVVTVAAPAGSLYVDPHPDIARITVQPTISTSQYTAKDAIGGLMTFANATRVSGGACVIEQVIIGDKDQERSTLDVVFFNEAITATTDNAIFDPTDAELDKIVASISVVGAGQYMDFSDNSAAVVNCGQVVKLVGTSLVGQIVCRASTGPTFTGTGDISVTVSVTRL